MSQFLSGACRLPLGRQYIIQIQFTYKYKASLSFYLSLPSLSHYPWLHDHARNETKRKQVLRGHEQASAVYLQASRCLSRDSDCTWPCWGRRFAAKMWPPPAPDGSVPYRQLPIAVFPTGPQPPAPDGSVLHRTGSRWQCSLPDLNRQLSMAVLPIPDLNRRIRPQPPDPGPQPPGPDGSVPHRTSTRRIPMTVFSTRPQPPALDGSAPYTGPRPPDQTSSAGSRTSTASSGWQCSPPDLHRFKCHGPLVIFRSELNILFFHIYKWLWQILPVISAKLEIVSFVDAFMQAFANDSNES